MNPTSAQDQGATFAVVVSNPAGTVTSAAATLTVLGEATFAWEAATQNPTGIWRSSGWSARSFRVLLDGALISESGDHRQADPPRTDLRELHRAARLLGAPGRRYAEWRR